MNHLIIMRGIPGSGKSTLAKKIKQKLLSNTNNEVLIVSADNYFIVNEEYNFNASKIHLAHIDCQIKADRFVKDKDGLRNCKNYHLIVDNTNIQFKYFKFYTDLAKAYGWRISLVEAPYMSRPYNDEDCFHRNVHGVPLDKIIQMRDNWETTQSCYLKINELDIE